MQNTQVSSPTVLHKAYQAKEESEESKEDSDDNELSMISRRISLI